MPSRHRFARLAAITLVLLLAVIVWGTLVRASGSGAGCANHWPLCNGEIVPRAPTVRTLIEFAHRVSSGAMLVAVVALALLGRRDLERGHPARRAAGFAVALTFVEAGVGASIVLLEKVGDDASAGRAVVMAVHLVNTFLLVASITLAWWWARRAPRGAVDWRSADGTAFAVGLVGVLIVGASGALTALGDTLFPATSLAAGLAQDLAPDAHPFLRLRFLHPMLALGVAGGWVVLASRFIGTTHERPLPALARGVLSMVTLQLVVGVVNLFLLAPIALQLVHLLVADLVWMSCVLFAAEALARREPVAAKP